MVINDEKLFVYDFVSSFVDIKEVFLKENGIFKFVELLKEMVEVIFSYFFFCDVVIMWCVNKSCKFIFGCLMFFEE